MRHFLIHTCNVCLLLWCTIWKMLFSVNKQIYDLLFTYSICPGLLCIMSYHSGTIRILTLNSWIIFFKEIIFCSVCLYKMFLPPLPPEVPFQSKQTGCPQNRQHITLAAILVMFSWEEAETCARLRAWQRGWETWMKEWAREQTMRQSTSTHMWTIPTFSFFN